MSTMQSEQRVDDGTLHFGVCPECGETDGCANVRALHIYYCKAHKTRWKVGVNLFSGWRDETEAEQRVRYDEIGLGTFSEVGSVHDEATILRLRAQAGS